MNSIKKRKLDRLDVDNFAVSKRIKWLDALKGFSIICVIIGHVRTSLFASGMYDSEVMERFEFVRLFHMKLFFILSGFSFYIAYLQEKLCIKKIKKQLANIVLLYFVYDIIRFFFKAIFSREVNRNVDTSYIYFCWYKHLDEYWYLYVLALLYAIVLLMWKKISANVSRTATFIILSLTISFFATAYNYLGEWTGSRVLVYLGFFLVGIYANGIKRIIPVFVWWIELLVGLIGIIWYLYNYDILSPLNWIIGLFISNSLFFLFYSYSAKIESLKIIGYLQKIGYHSLEIYLLHVYYTSGLRPVIKQLHIDTWWLAFMLLMLLGIVGPIVLSIILRKLYLWDIVFRPVSLINKVRNKYRGNQIDTKN